MRVEKQIQKIAKCCVKTIIEKNQENKLQTFLMIGKNVNMGLGVSGKN